MIAGEYVVTVAATFGAVIEIVVSGVVNVPGTAAGVVRVTVVKVLTVPLVPIAPGLASVSIWPLAVMTPGLAPVPVMVNCVALNTDATATPPAAALL